MRLERGELASWIELVEQAPRDATMQSADDFRVYACSFAVGAVAEAIGQALRCLPFAAGLKAQGDERSVQACLGAGLRIGSEFPTDLPTG